MLWLGVFAMLAWIAWKVMVLEDLVRTALRGLADMDVRHASALGEIQFVSRGVLHSVDKEEMDDLRSREGGLAPFPIPNRQWVAMLDEDTPHRFPGLPL